MTSLYIIENKIESIKRNLKTLKGFRKYSPEVLEKEPITNGAVRWYLYIVLQDSISLAEAVIALKFQRKPTTYSDCFYILQDEKIISPKLQEDLIKMTGFRNRMIHEYEKVDFRTISDILKNDLKDIEKFILSIKTKLKI